MPKPMCETATLRCKSTGTSLQYKTAGESCSRSFVLLSPVHTDTMNHQSESFAILPVELQLKIFSYLTPRELRQDVSLVCKEWLELSEDPSLWTVLSFCARSEASLNSFCQVLTRCSMLRLLKMNSKLVSANNVFQYSTSFPQLKHVELCCVLDSEALQTLIINCSQIEYLRLTESIFCGQHPEVHFDSLLKLRHLDLSHTIDSDDPNPSVEVWSVSSEVVNDSCLTRIARYCQVLESLNFENCDGNITDAALFQLAEHRAGTLTSLRISGDMLTDVGILSLLSCKKLSVLHITDACLLTSKTLKAICRMPLLTELGLASLSCVTSSDLSTFFMNSELLRLTSLRLEYLEIDDSGMKHLSKTCKNLKRLLMLVCYNITDEGLNSVIENCHMLFELELNNMNHLSDEIMDCIPVQMPNLKCFSFWACGPSKKSNYFPDRLVYW